MDSDDAQNAALLAELRQMTAMSDPVPPDAVLAARSAFAWRRMDAELAELTADSSVDLELAGVRGVATPTVLTFDGPGLSVEVEIVEMVGTRRILGQVVPPGPGQVDVRHRDGVITVALDEVGRFSADAIAAGPVSLRCTAVSTVVETDWFLV